MDNSRLWVKQQASVSPIRDWRPGRSIVGMFRPWCTGWKVRTLPTSQAPRGQRRHLATRPAVAQFADVRIGPLEKRGAEPEPRKRHWPEKQFFRPMCEQLLRARRFGGNRPASMKMSGNY